MMPKACTILILLVGLGAASVQSSAIKGQQQQQQQQLMAQQAEVARSVKSPMQQHSERGPKSAPVVGPVQQQQASAPVLESSKKVYNDESIRRSAAAAEPAQVAVKSAAPAQAAPAPVQAAPVPVVAESSEPAKSPVLVAQPVAAPAVAQPVVQPAVVQPQPVAPVAAAPAPVVEAMKPTFVEHPAPKSADEMPAQSERSAPIKDEAPVKAEAPASVIVEHVVPAKSAEVVPVQAADSQLGAKKDEPAPSVPAKEQAAAAAAAEPIEVPAPDPGLVLSEPIDSTTKLLIDLDEHVQKFLPAEDKQEQAAPAKEQILVSGVDYSPAAGGAVAAAPGAPEAQPSGKSSVPLVPYSSSNVDNVVPPLPSSLEKVEKASGSAPVSSAAAAAAAAGASATRQANHQHQNQQQVITQLLDQLDSLQNRIQDTINQLVARRRYVMSALLRPMGTYVRRVRTNLERLQNRVNQLQAAAVSMGGSNNSQRPGGFVDAAAIETIRRRIDDISKRISDIVNRIRFSLTPTSAPLNNNGRK